MVGGVRPLVKAAGGEEARAAPARVSTETGSRRRKSNRERTRTWGSSLGSLHPAVAAVEEETARAAAVERNQRIGAGKLRRRHGRRRRLIYGIAAQWLSFDAAASKITWQMLTCYVK